MKEPSSFQLRREIVQRGGVLDPLAESVGVSTGELALYVCGHVELAKPHRIALSRVLWPHGAPVPAPPRNSRKAR